MPILVLHHMGRKSGEARTAPLNYITDGDDLVIAASKAAALWPRFVAAYDDYAEYAQAAGREIPLVRLKPR